MKTSSQSYSVVIPVYNSQDNLVSLTNQLKKTLSSLKSPYEVILVNDGSQDKSWQIIKKLSAQFPWVKAVDLMKNYGQHNAILCGIRLAKHDIIITMDDDLQHPPSQIPALIKHFNQGFDVVYGTPKQDQHILWRNFASSIIKLALKTTMGIKMANQVSSFRVFRTSLRQSFKDYHAPQVSIDVLLTWATTNFSSVQVKHHSRHLGKSNYNFLKLLNHALNMITGFSTKPLKLATLLGFSFTLFGLGIFIYVIGRYFLLGNHVTGFPFLASIIAIFSGVQLFAIGIIGEYLSRIYLRILNHPSYTIRKTTNNKK